METIKNLNCFACGAAFMNAGTTEYRDNISGKLVAPPIQTIRADHAPDCPMVKVARKVRR